jgi:threonine dehydratase
LAERNCIIAEGAGAVSVDAALTGKAGGGKVVCVISGGNIDKSKLVQILEGKLP